MQNKDFFPDPKEKLDASDDFASFLQAEGGGDWRHYPVHPFKVR